MTTDWHPADIIAALRKKGTSLAALSRASGLGSSTLANALSPNILTLISKPSYNPQWQGVKLRMRCRLLKCGFVGVLWYVSFLLDTFKFH
ncbi:helix-turn-helix domain-containing protein [Cronobacter sakazakii]|uniref:helix-turn-helix domain-containing protein n=1 Tax=Cronobacter sakazakii TaxID=28141 RepID=UPI002894C3C4|nr:helix-turn-helix domain-containing protein [Cronobacter sakazakii]MDT3533027.1 helix-turn-helix domain-containing protein [Cronobacter sakazakii]